MRSLVLVLICCVAISGVAGCGQGADSTPAVSVDVQSNKPITEDQLGVKFYPGARLVTSGQVGSTVSASLETSDPADKAVAFYENELGAKSDGKTPLATIEATKGGTKYAIVITASAGVTSIAVMGDKKSGG